jgi:hypothetical protein
VRPDDALLAKTDALTQNGAQARHMCLTALLERPVTAGAGLASCTPLPSVSVGAASCSPGREVLARARLRRHWLQPALTSSPTTTGLSSGQAGRFGRSLTHQASSGVLARIEATLPGP